MVGSPWKAGTKAQKNKPMSWIKTDTMEINEYKRGTRENTALYKGKN